MQKHEEIEKLQLCLRFGVETLEDLKSFYAKKPESIKNEFADTDSHMLLDMCSNIANNKCIRWVFDTLGFDSIEVNNKRYLGDPVEPGSMLYVTPIRKAVRFDNWEIVYLLASHPNCHIFDAYDLIVHHQCKYENMERVMAVHPLDNMKSIFTHVNRHEAAPGEFLYKYQTQPNDTRKKLRIKFKDLAQQDAAATFALTTLINSQLLIQK